MRRQLLGPGANTDAGFEELQVSLLLFSIVYIVLRFFLVLYEYSGVESPCGEQSLTVNQAPHAGSSFQDGPLLDSCKRT